MELSRMLSRFVVLRLEFTHGFREKQICVLLAGREVVLLELDGLVATEKFDLVVGDSILNQLPHIRLSSVFDIINHR